MVTPESTALRAKVDAELAELRPKLRGVQGFLRLVSLSGQSQDEAAETRNVIAGKIEQLTERIRVLEATRGQLGAYEDAALVTTDPTTAAVIADLLEDVQNLQAALGLFTAQDLASKGIINLKIEA